MNRKIDKIVTGTNTTDGAGVNLVRVISRPNVYDFDPFLMLDAFDSKNPNDYIKGFPWHPHRGIETVTYLIKGKIEHGDSIGNSGVITDGSCQWMTAGGGILHQEMPKEADHMLGVQLWINLPAKDKMTAPKYRDITSEKVVSVTEDNANINIVAGEYKGNKSIVTPDFVKANFLDIKVTANAKWEIKTDEKETVFIYVLEGDAQCIGETNEIIEKKHAYLFTKGDNIQIKTTDNEIRFLLFSGLPLNESIAWGGPIVMNTKEELQKAFDDLDKGTFVKHW